MKETPAHKIAASIAVFLFCLIATTIVLSFFCQTWFIVGLAIIIVVLSVLGYLFAACFGFAVGAGLWLSGVIGGILSSVSDPIINFFHGLGL